MRKTNRCPTCGQVRSGKKLEMPVLCDRIIEKLEKDNALLMEKLLDARAKYIWEFEGLDVDEAFDKAESQIKKEFEGGT